MAFVHRNTQVYDQLQTLPSKAAKLRQAWWVEKKLILLFHKFCFIKKRTLKKQITKIRQYNPDAVLWIRIQEGKNYLQK